jgi:hypothetical protein
MKTSARLGWVWAGLFIFPLLLMSCQNLQHDEWPLIKEVSVRHHFAENKESEQLKLVIYARNSKPLYCLDARFCWRDYELEDYDFSGTLDCRLYPLSESSSSVTLLQNVVHSTRDWETYGRFLHEELIGLAGADASRSIVQRCGVRGMIIIIRVFNIKKDKEKGSIVSFDMTFTARNSTSKERPYANGPIAAH